MVGPAHPGFSLRNCILHLKPVSQNPLLFPQSVMLDHKKDFNLSTSVTMGIICRLDGTRSIWKSVTDMYGISVQFVGHRV